MSPTTNPNNVISCHTITLTNPAPPCAITDNSSDDDDDFGDGSLLEKDSFSQFPAPTVPSSSASFVGGGQNGIASTLTSEGLETPSSNGSGGGTQSPQLGLLLPFVPRLVSEDRWRRKPREACGLITLQKSIVSCVVHPEPSG